MQMQTNFRMSTKTRFEKEAKGNSDSADHKRCVQRSHLRGYTNQKYAPPLMLVRCSFSSSICKQFGRTNEFAVFSTVITTVQKK